MGETREKRTSCRLITRDDNRVIFKDPSQLDHPHRIHLDSILQPCSSCTLYRVEMRPSGIRSNQMMILIPIRVLMMEIITMILLSFDFFSEWPFGWEIGIHGMMSQKEKIAVHLLEMSWWLFFSFLLWFSCYFHLLYHWVIPVHSVASSLSFWCLTDSWFLLHHPHLLLLLRLHSHHSSSWWASVYRLNIETDSHDCPILFSSDMSFEWSLDTEIQMRIPNHFFQLTGVSSSFFHLIQWHFEWSWALLRFFLDYYCFLSSCYNCLSRDIE